MNIAQLLARAAGRHAERPALALGTTVVADYAAFAGGVARLAGGLAARLRPGDRVGLVIKNSPEYAQAMFACWHAGLVAVPINAKLHPKELEYILGHSGCRLCFAGPDLLPDLADLAVPALDDVVAPGGDAWRTLFASPLPMVERAPDDPAWLFYTSGTTGRPKGVTLTQRNLMAATLNYFSDVDTIVPGDAIIHAAPMSHGSGFYMLPHVAKGAVNVTPVSGGFEPAEIFELLRVHQGVTMFAAPTMVKRLVEHRDDGPLPGLKTIVYGGGPMYITDCQAALARFGNALVQIFGQGESPMTITCLPRADHADTGHPRHLERLASVGLAFTGVDVRVGGPDDAALPPGEIGEVLVRGDTVMAGYWENPTATAETLRNGWLHTGDVGRLDADGYLTLMDRSKDVIISGGSNIYPREVEEVLLRHPAVSEVSVVGARDAEWGEIVVAFVVPRGTPPQTGELDALCLESIARFKRPKRYVMVDGLPKNNTGKVLKTRLRERLA